MIIKVNDEIILELNETKKKVILNDVLEEIFDEDLKRRIQWIIMHKYQECFDKLKREWDFKLKQRGIKMIPTDEDEYAELIFSQEDYRSRSQREKEVC